MTRNAVKLGHRVDHHVHSVFTIVDRGELPPELRRDIEGSSVLYWMPETPRRAVPCAPASDEDEVTCDLRVDQIPDLPREVVEEAGFGAGSDGLATRGVHLRVSRPWNLLTGDIFVGRS